MLSVKHYVTFLSILGSDTFVIIEGALKGVSNTVILKVFEGYSLEHTTYVRISLTGWRSGGS